MNLVLSFLVGVFIVTGGWFTYNNFTEDPLAVGAPGRVFTSAQLGTGAVADYILSTNGATSTWIANSGGGGGGSFFTYNESTNVLDSDSASTTSTTSIKTAYIVATSTTATSTFAGDVYIGDSSVGFFYDSINERLSLGGADNTLAINGATALGSKLSSHVVGITDIFDITTHSHNDTALFGTAFGMARSRGTEASPTIIQDDDTASRIISYGFDGTDYAELSRIDTYVDGAPSDGTDMPGRMVFATTPDGSGTASDRLIIDSAGRVGINTLQANMLDTFSVTGSMNLIHTAVENDDHAFEIDLDAAGFGDVKAVDIVYTTGALSSGEEEAVMLLNIDESAATGGDVAGLEVLATEGGLDAAYGMKTGVGISPILSKTGSFGNVTVASTTASGSTTVAFNSAATDVTLFASDNDVVVVGRATQFDEIEFLLDTPASGAGIAPTFEFSTGAGTWTSFVPVDGTNGMKNTGIIDFELADIPTWATGADGNYLIRITRTRNTLATAPIEDKVQIVLSVEYKWDLNGDILVRTATATNLVSTNATSTQSFFSALGTFTNSVINTLLTAVGGIFTGSLEIPNGANPTVDVDGEIAIDTTSDQLIFFSTDKKVLVATTTKMGNIASTTKDGSGAVYGTATSTFLLGNFPYPVTLKGVNCTATSSGQVSLNFIDGSGNATEGVACTTGGRTALSTNTTFTAGEDFKVQIGSYVAGADRVTFTADFINTAE